MKGPHTPSRQTRELGGGREKGELREKVGMREYQTDTQRQDVLNFWADNLASPFSSAERCPGSRAPHWFS